MLVHEASRSLLLRVRNPAPIMQAVPKHRLIDIRGHNLAVRHGFDEVRVLRNLGIPAPSPILTQYDWPGRYTPFAHQRETAAMLTLHRRAFILSDMGTGKTSSILWAADYLMRVGAVRRVLVAAKLSTLERVWLEEAFNLLMHRTAVVLHGTRARREERLAQEADFYIINHEGLEVVRPAIKAREDIDLIVVDEAAEYRNSRTARYETLTSILQPRHRLWLATATPCPNSPVDAWALAKLVCPERVPKFFTAWRRSVMLQITQYKWAPRPDASAQAYAAMQPAVRFRKQDCLDLPPVLVEDRQVKLSKEQHTAYESMRAELVLEAKSVTLTAVNAADRINKLRQIACGACRTPEGEYLELDHAKRLAVLLECIAEAQAKTLVVVPFKGVIASLARELRAHYSCATLNGDVGVSARNEIITRFKSLPDPQVLLCHPKVMAHGLNLTEADMLVFYAPIYSNDEAQQVVERFNRPGQTRKMTVVRLGATSLEWAIYGALDAKRTAQENILELYRREVLK